jgi:uncharacterized metal-binding protein
MPEMSNENCCCSGGVKLIFACSGASDVGEIADRTARKLTREGFGRMYCLTGIGGRVASIVKTTRAADAILAIDGCAQACAKHCLEQAGFKCFTHLQLGALGMEKGMSPATDGAVHHAMKAAKELGAF